MKVSTNRARSRGTLAVMALGAWHAPRLCEGRAVPCRECTSFAKPQGVPLSRLVRYDCARPLGGTLAVMALVLLGSLAAAQDPAAQGRSEVKKGEAKRGTAPHRGAPVSATGQVLAYEEVALYARVATTVANVSVQLGERVKRGQILVELDTPDAQVELTQKTALVEQARAEIERARSSVRAAQAACAADRALTVAGEAGCKSAGSQHLFRHKQVDRLKGLLDVKAIDVQIVDEARHHLDAAQAALAAAEANLQAARARADEGAAKLDRAQADLRVAEARLRVAQADVERAQLTMQWAQVRSPIDGIVTLRGVDRYTFVSAGGSANAKPLVTVARTDRVRVVVAIADRDVPLIDPGTPVTVAIHALPGKQFDGKVSRIGASVDPTTHVMQIEIDLPNPDGRLLPGLSASVTFKSDK